MFRDYTENKNRSDAFVIDGFMTATRYRDNVI